MGNGCVEEKKNIKIVKLIKITFLNNKNRDELKDKKKVYPTKKKAGDFNSQRAGLETGETINKREASTRFRVRKKSAREAEVDGRSIWYKTDDSWGKKGRREMEKKDNAKTEREIERPK